MFSLFPIIFFNEHQWLFFRVNWQFLYNFWIFILINRVISKLAHPFIWLHSSTFRFYFKVVIFWVRFI